MLRAELIFVRLGVAQIYICFIENTNGMMEEIQIYGNGPANGYTFQLTRADIVSARGYSLIKQSDWS